MEKDGRCGVRDGRWETSEMGLAIEIEGNVNQGPVSLSGHRVGVPHRTSGTLKSKQNNKL